MMSFMGYWLPDHCGGESDADEDCYENESFRVGVYLMSSPSVMLPDHSDTFLSHDTELARDAISPSIQSPVHKVDKGTQTTLPITATDGVIKDNNTNTKVDHAIDESSSSYARSPQTNDPVADPTIKKALRPKDSSSYRRCVHRSTRITCHQCGNIRTPLWTCSNANCVQSFCIHCVGRLMERWKTHEVFTQRGCPSCMCYCCCNGYTSSTKSTSVRQTACPRQWPTTLDNPSLHCIRCRHKFGGKRYRKDSETYRHRRKSPITARREPYNQWARACFSST
jgi:hypothetical protein